MLNNTTLGSTNTTFSNRGFSISAKATLELDFKAKGEKDSPINIEVSLKNAEELYLLKAILSRFSIDFREILGEDNSISIFLADHPICFSC